jgi:HEAT repeat protein
MRWLLLAGMLLLPLGCRPPAPTLAHGQPVAHWLDQLQQPGAAQRKKAVQVLSNVGTADPAVLPALTTAVKDRDAGVRGEAVLALLKMGPAAQDAAPVLREAAKDRDPRIRANAAKALARVEGNP